MFQRAFIRLFQAQPTVAGSSRVHKAGYHEINMADPFYRSHHNTDSQAVTVTVRQLHLPDIPSDSGLSYAHFAYNIMDHNLQCRLGKSEIDAALMQALIRKYRVQNTESLPDRVAGLRRRMEEESAEFWRARGGPSAS